MSTKRSLKDRHDDDGSSSKTNAGMNNKTPFVPSVEYLTGQVDVLQAQVGNLTTEKELLLVENAQLKAAAEKEKKEERVQNVTTVALKGVPAARVAAKARINEHTLDVLSLTTKKLENKTRVHANC